MKYILILSMLFWIPIEHVYFKATHKHTVVSNYLVKKFIIFMARK